ncbi:2OG-Fe(II) oxygenase [Rhodococcus sp. NPDC058639]|uniref:2OG-Fe(II) oxygenase n=1 Tax=Rhodococcus sp. NPDC058639 TaxID=3346570 RepID=UPI003646093D
MAHHTSKLADRVDALPWAQFADDLDNYGCAATGPLLEPSERTEILSLWDDDTRFRTTVDMARHRYGHGTYKYFGAPVPDPVAQLRATFYHRLLAPAREWAERLGDPAPWPDDFDEWLEMCHAAGQSKPAPLMLRYVGGDWNALHRDLYGDLAFPLQVVIGLDRPGVDYSGGEFMLVEQRPRAQSRGTATVIEQGHALIFTTRDRPTRGARGWTRSPVRHGVSTVRSGLRRTLGLVLHDAA